MSAYTVHEPPLRDDDSVPDPERFVFVRDGFYFWAFLLAPLWMLRRGLWLVLLGYVVLMTAINVGLAFVGASLTIKIAIHVLVGLLVGFEAATLRRFTLARRGWRNVGIVVADGLDTAERRFFDSWVKDDAYRPAPPPASSASVPAVRRRRRR